MTTLSKIAAKLPRLAERDIRSILVVGSNVLGRANSCVTQKVSSTSSYSTTPSFYLPSHENSIATIQARRHMSTVLAMATSKNYLGSLAGMDEYDTIMSSPSPVSCQRLSQISERVKENGSSIDVINSQKEWDELLQDHRAQFELMKEDPYFSDFEEMEPEWQRFHCEHDIVQKSSCEINGGDLDVEADCVQTCIHG